MVVVAALLGAPAAARACSGRMTPWLAFPGPGATEVSPQSSIYVSGIRDTAGLTVELNGQPVSLGRTESLSSEWWRVQAGLLPGTSYVVRGLDNGVPRELTRFTTAAAYDKTLGTAAKLTRLRLWRVHYPKEMVAAGGCVFSEFEGYISVDYQPGAVPATPDGEVLTVFRLYPKTGGATENFAYPGLARQPLAQWENPSPNRAEEVPDGRLPSPLLSVWKPELAPDREYCVTVTLYGRNDVAALPVTSEPICAGVTNLAWNKEGTAVADGGGCSVSGGSPAAGVFLTVVITFALGRRGRARRRC